MNHTATFTWIMTFPCHHMKYYDKSFYYQWRRNQVKYVVIKFRSFSFFWRRWWPSNWWLQLRRKRHFISISTSFNNICRAISRMSFNKTIIIMSLLWTKWKTRLLFQLILVFRKVFIVNPKKEKVFYQSKWVLRWML